MPTLDCENRIGPAPSLPAHVATPVIVNGVAIPRRKIAAEVQNFPGRTPLESWLAATRALVIRELLLQEAQRLDIPVAPETDADGRQETKDDALIRALIEREVQIPKADDESLRRFYDNNRRRFVTSPLYEVEHILFAARRNDAAAFAAARAKACAIAATLAQAPDRFAEFARALSDCPSAQVGGQLGQIALGDTTPDFAQALIRLAPGELSAPVETRYGVHLIRLARKVEGAQLPFEAVKDRIAAYLEAHVYRQATRQYIALLIGRAEISGIALDGAASSLVQ